MRIGSLTVGRGERPVFVAEVSGNHGGSLDEARRLIEAVAQAGAQAVKLQTYTPDTITLRSPNPRFRVGAEHDLWGGRELYELYEEAHTPWSWHEELFELARSRGLEVFSSPFDETAVDFLESLDVPAYKIASLEIVDLPLIRKAASTGKPLILSTGTASLAEIDDAVRAARSAGDGEIMLLACTSSYPAHPQDAHLARLRTMQDAWDVDVGLSDHTTGSAVAITAVALGASLVEKHVIRDRAVGGPDAAFSLEPEDVATTVEALYDAWASIGRRWIAPTAAEGESLRLRPSLCVTRDLPAGHVLGPEDVDSLRPAGGLPPDARASVLGRRLTVDVGTGDPVTWDLLR
jgi:N-acetylneuraminate synthase